MMSVTRKNEELILMNEKLLQEHYYSRAAKFAITILFQLKKTVILLPKLIQSIYIDPQRVLLYLGLLIFGKANIFKGN